jgi:hypothetical protein
MSFSVIRTFPACTCTVIGMKRSALVPVMVTCCPAVELAGA